MRGYEVHLYQDVYDGLSGSLSHKSRALESSLHVNGGWGRQKKKAKSVCGMENANLIKKKGSLGQALSLGFQPAG